MISREWKMRCYEKARRWLVNHARDCAPGNHPRRWSNQELRACGIGGTQASTEVMRIGDAI